MRRSLLLVVLLAAAQTGPACRFFKPRTVPYPAGVGFPLMADGFVPFKGRPAGGIRARGGSIYMSTRAGYVWSIDVAGRKAAWKFKTDNRLLEPPFPGAENVYARDEADVLYSLSPGGELLWKRPVGEKILTPVVEGGGRVFFGTDTGKLWSIALDGKDDRVFQADGPVAVGPLVSGSRVIFGSDDGNLHVHDLGGKALWTFRAPGKVVGPIGSDGKSLFFSTADRRHFCLKIGGTRPKWQVRLGGVPTTEPVIRGRRLYFLATNSVLYGIGRSGGDVLWWANVPSRTAYDLAVVEDKVIVASLSSVLLAFDAATGRKVGEFAAGRDLSANAAWVDPFLVIMHHEAATDEGKLVLLKKEVQVLLSAQKASPLPAGDEIPFAVSVVGFFNPRYEFYVKTGDKREVIQKASPKSTWTWYAETEGAYTVGVAVTDAKQSREAEVPFVIEKRPEKKPEEPEKKEMPK
jgi:outer membrane protein assembly factor BamB